MRKIILSLVSSLIFIPITRAECSVETIKSYGNNLGNIPINIEYASEYVDMNGDAQEGYFAITGNIGDDFALALFDGVGNNSFNSETQALVPGGVYTLRVYHYSCPGQIIKEYEIKIPSYKQYCNIDKNCDKNVWFDGTYSIKVTEEETVEEKVDSKLVIILVSLIIIVLAFSIITILRRKRRLS